MQFYWRKDRDTYRVWRSNWSGDMFEVLYQPEFDELRKWCKRFSITILEAGDEDD